MRLSIATTLSHVYKSFIGDAAMSAGGDGVHGGRDQRLGRCASADAVKECTGFGALVGPITLGQFALSGRRPSNISFLRR